MSHVQCKCYIELCQSLFLLKANLPFPFKGLVFHLGSILNLNRCCYMHQLTTDQTGVDLLNQAANSRWKRIAARWNHHTVNTAFCQWSTTPVRVDTLTFQTCPGANTLEPHPSPLGEYVATASVSSGGASIVYTHTTMQDYVWPTGFTLCQLGPLILSKLNKLCDPIA